MDHGAGALSRSAIEWRRVLAVRHEDFLRGVAAVARAVIRVTCGRPGSWHWYIASCLHCICRRASAIAVLQHAGLGDNLGSQFFLTVSHYVYAGNPGDLADLLNQVHAHLRTWRKEIRAGMQRRAANWRKAPRFSKDLMSSI